MMLKNRLLSGALPVLALVMAGASSATQAAVSYSTSFESPTFSPANLDGQNGWASGSINSGTMNVVSNAAGAQAGSQFVSYDTANATTDGSYSKYMNIPYTLSTAAAAASPEFEASVYLKIAPNGSADNLSWGGIDLISATGRIGYIQFASNGNAAVAVTGGSTTGSAAPNLIAGEYNKLTIKVDFDTDAVQFYINDTLYRQGTSSNAGSLTIAAIYASRTPASAGHVFSFDNVSLTAVPEPAAAGLLMLGGLALTARRRKR